MKANKFVTFISFFATTLLVGSCGTSDIVPTSDIRNWDYTESIIDDKYRNFYEVYVRSFYDADGDGYGDLRGLGLKMDYIHDLGFNGVWMMPIHQSNSYHKYDVDDYYSIDANYGTMDDFNFMIKKANENNIAVIMDLVVNHSSSNHKWFKDAIEGLTKYSTPSKDNKPSEECIKEYPTTEYYNFVYSQNKPIGGTYYKVKDGFNWWYEGVFSSEMPDLNLNCEKLKLEIVNIMKFWLNKGVKGFRLDAALHFFSSTTKNIEFLTWIEEEAKKIYPNVYFVAEVWSGASTVQEYYKSDLDSFFNFSNSQSNGTVVSSINNYNAKYFVETVVEYEKRVKENNSSAIVANFLGNHDMQRIANGCIRSTENENGTRKAIIDFDFVKLALGLNQMISGTSWVYYGEEISMVGGGNNDPSYRTAMLWSDDEYQVCKYNPPGSTTVEQYCDIRNKEIPIGNVEEQLEDSNSVLNYLKIATRLRYKYPAIARGEQAAITFKNSIDHPIVEYAMLEKTYNNEKLYILINMSPEIENVTLPNELAKLVVSDTLSTNGEASTIKKGIVKAAPYSITIMK